MADPSADLEHLFGAAYRLPATGSTTLGDRTLGLVTPPSGRVGRAPTLKGGEMRLGTLLLIIIVVLLVLFLLRGRRRL
jgi:hypothetical protein